MGAGVLTFDPETHTYRLDGRVVPSVTQILKGVYPGVYANIPPAVLERKARLGTAVHKAIELELDGGRLDWDNLHPEVRPYMLSWAKWWRRHSVTEGCSETQFYSSAGYAGTRDFRAIVDGRSHLIDWKITSNKVPTHDLQITAYNYGSEAQSDVCGCLYLRSDGERAEFIETKCARLLPDWLATLRVYNIMERMK